MHRLVGHTALYFRRGCRHYKILALESSCDDSCVALLEKQSPNSLPVVIDEKKATLRSVEAGGVIPTEAFLFHQLQMPPLVQSFCHHHGLSIHTPPDLLCVTQGPGMTGSLSLTLQFAKGLSFAWNVPIVGTHHMLGHILASFLPSSANPAQPPPQYPFLSLLCSGGHTMLVLLKSLTHHEIIANTLDIACGDALDKSARELGMKGNMIGPELERFVASILPEEKAYFASIDTTTGDNEFLLKINPPLRKAKHRRVPENVSFTFAFLLSTIKRYQLQFNNGSATGERTRRFFAFKVQELLFDHIIDRLNVALYKHSAVGTNEFADGKFDGVKDFVCSGGVAANQRLREKLFTELKFHNDLTFHFPDLKVCTDNATMIGVAGLELFERLGAKSTLDMLPVARWPLNQLLDLGSWEKVSDEEYEKITGWKR